KFKILSKEIIVIAGANDFSSLANELDIKIMEMVPMMTRSFELEEFIHGPQNAFSHKMFFVIFVKKDEDCEKAKQISKFLKNEIGGCSLIGDLKVDNADCYLEFKSKDFKFLELLTFVQIFAYEISNSKGRDLRRSLNSNINNYIQKSV
ncbi:MAG: hypothetical protein ACK5G7_04790, partial [Erysipelotrichaceae bacterium]